METTSNPSAPADYHRLLANYLRSHSESDLYHASLLSQICIESGLGPEDIIALHFEALDGVVAGSSNRDRIRAHADAQEFLLEVMIAYGVKYKEYLELRLQENLRDVEARAARDRERVLEAERIGAEKDELLGVIAHELRSPLTAARGSVDLASRRLATGEVEAVPRLLGQAREALDRLSRLTGDLVEASRGELPRFEKAPLPLAEIVAQACAWAQPSAASRSITLDFQRPQADVRVLGNADALLSVFGNLLSNAIRYTLPNGTVAVRLMAGPRLTTVEVRDSGIGMTTEERERIFQRFYRGPSARRVEPQGLGLGLSLVQSIVQSHAGRIEVESEPGQGSTFRVLVPSPPSSLTPMG